MSLRVSFWTTFPLGASSSKISLLSSDKIIQPHNSSKQNPHFEQAQSSSSFTEPIFTTPSTSDAKMPRILSQGMSCHGSMTPHRRTPLRDKYSGSSHFSLTRNKSSSTSLMQMVMSYSVCDHRTSWPSYPPEKQSGVWNTQETPSLAGSDTSVQTDRSSSSLSRTSSRSSLRQSPSPPASDPRSAALSRFYALHQRTSLQQQQQQQRQTAGGMPSTYLCQARLKQEDTWGQFVDVADAEEELVRTIKFLSIRRHLATSRN